MTLRQRVQRIEDTESIRALVHRAAWTMDYRQYDEWADCFMSDGEWMYYNPDGTLRTHLKGRVAIRDEVVTGNERFPNFGLKHHVVNSVMRELDTRHGLQTSFYFTFERQPDGGFLPRTSGRYFDAVERCDDKRWRIRRREVRSDFGSAKVIASREIDAS